MKLHECQRGFVHGRQLVRNVVDLDTHARIFSMSATKEHLPALAFWDFAAAFPSVIHEFLFLAIAFFGLPEGFCNLIEGIYYINLAYIDMSGLSEWRSSGMPLIWHDLYCLP